MSFYEEIADIVATVEGQGGALLPDPCVGRKLTYTIPPKNRKIKAETCGCYAEHGMETMIVSTYDPSDSKKERKKMLARGAGYARACIVCDAVGDWPKIKEARKD